MNTSPSLRGIIRFLAASALLAVLPGARAQTVATFSSLHSFTGGDGGNPDSTLTEGGDGSFYGVTTLGGTSETGAIYELTAFETVEPLFSFGVANKDAKDGGAGGIYPKGSLVEVGNTFYGTTTAGGDFADGTIFSFTTVPSVSVLTFYTFDADASGNADGSSPNAGLIVGNDGAFYGTAYQGGTYNGGTVFRATSGYDFVALYDFGHPATTEGTTLYGSLVQTSDGYFYGTTYEGGQYGAGTVFQLTPENVLHTLYSFGALDANGVNADGANPAAGLALGSDGALYGTTSRGGTSSGTVFRVTTNGDFQTLHAFAGLNGDDTNADGATPLSALVLGADGNFYGTTSTGGNSSGTIFQITPAGVLTTLYAFSVTNSDDDNNDGAHPRAPLATSSYGSFYGTTFDGGTGARGTVFVLSLLPSITSPNTVVGEVNAPFSYQFAATNHPTSYSVDAAIDGDLPPGLSLDAASGLISGTPTQAGTFAVTIFVHNAFGSGTFASGTETLTFTILGPPVITSATSAEAQVGAPFSFQIVATDFPMGYTATELPPGLMLDPAAGLISGTPTTTGVYGVTLSASNAAGTGTATLSLTVTTAPVPVPVVTSATDATAQVGQPFTYQIAGTNEPTSFNASGLPPGLTVDTVGGLISGTPTAAGSYTVALSATNAGGTGTAQTTFLVTTNPVVAPVITSAVGSTPAHVGVPFAYQITGTNLPTSFGASGLPVGLSVDPSTGLISGAPATSGTYPVTLSATNAGGTGMATLSLVIVAMPTVTIAVAGDGDAVEDGAAGKVIIRRDGDLTNPLMVRYKEGGTAVSGTDYRALPKTATIPAGAAAVKVKVKALDDAANGGTRFVKVKLKAATDGSYLLGPATVAKVLIVPGE